MDGLKKKIVSVSKTGKNSKQIKKQGLVLIAAVRKSDLLKVSEIIQLAREDELDILNFEDSKENTPLNLAACEGKYDIAKLLLEAGADVNYQTRKTKETAVYFLIRKYDQLYIDRFLKLFTQYQCNLNITNAYGQTPLSSILLFPSVTNVIRLLCQNGADVNYQGLDGLTPLMQAVMGDIMANAMQLVDLGAEVNYETASGETPLSQAVLFGAVSMVEFLISRGADYNHVDKVGNSLVYSSSAQDPAGFKQQVLEILIAFGADIDKRNVYESSPIEGAILLNNLKAVECLYHHNADLMPSGKLYVDTLADYAKILGHIAIAKFLQREPEKKSWIVLAPPSKDTNERVKNNGQSSKFDVPPPIPPRPNNHSNIMTPALKVMSNSVDATKIDEHTGADQNSMVEKNEPIEKQGEVAFKNIDLNLSLFFEKCHKLTDSRIREIFNEVLVGMNNRLGQINNFILSHELDSVRTAILHEEKRIERALHHITNSGSSHIERVRVVGYLTEINAAFCHVLPEKQLVLRRSVEPVEVQVEKEDCLWSCQKRLHDSERFLMLLKELWKIGDGQPWKISSCFISYAWPSEEYQDREKQIQPFLAMLKKHLEIAGHIVHLDIKDNRPGKNIYSFMNRIEGKVDHVLLVGSQSLLKKHNEGTSAVCNELILAKRERMKQEDFIIPLLLTGGLDEAFPAYLEMYTNIVIWRDEGYLEGLKRLLQVLYGIGSEVRQFNEFWENEVAQCLVESNIGPHRISHHSAPIISQAPHSQLFRAPAHENSDNDALSLINGIAEIRQVDGDIVVGSAESREFLRNYGLSSEEKRNWWQPNIHGSRAVIPIDICINPNSNQIDFLRHRDMTAVEDFINQHGSWPSIDNPKRPFPKDGTWSWETPVYQDDSSKSYVRYTAGPADTEWMHEKNQRYIRRITSPNQGDSNIQLNELVKIEKELREALKIGFEGISFRMYPTSSRHLGDGFHNCHITGLPNPLPQDAVESYRDRRENGQDEDNPTRPFPQDGHFAFTEPHSNPSRVTYVSGPRDREWMDEKDRNYIARRLRSIEFFNQSVSRQMSR